MASLVVLTVAVNNEKKGNTNEIETTAHTKTKKRKEREQEE